MEFYTALSRQCVNECLLKVELRRLMTGTNGVVQKCHFHEHTESRECSWIPGSESLSQLPLKMSRKNLPLVYITHRNEN